MTIENKKYEQILNVLKKSKPVFRNAEAVSEKIIKQLSEERSKISPAELIIEYLFGWTYIGWVRRSMIAAVVAIICLFGYQQALILKRINDLSGQRIQNCSLIMTDMTNDLTGKMLLFRIAGKKLSEGKASVPEKEIDKMISTLNKLQVKYKDLFYLIENDPRLKKYVETRLNELKDTKN